MVEDEKTGTYLGVDENGIILDKPTYSGQRSKCYECGREMIGACGDINIHHWRHDDEGTKCWVYEPKTGWHTKWQNLFDDHKREVTIEKEGVRHRADVYHNGYVYEFQHSPISVKDIIEREEFYGKMIWVVDAREFKIMKTRKTCMFHWFNRRKAWEKANKPIFFDLGNGLHLKILQIKRDVIRVMPVNLNSILYNYISELKIMKENEDAIWKGVWPTSLALDGRYTKPLY